MRIGVIGAGSIGAVLARGFEQLGHTVGINDADPDRADRLDFPALTKGALATQADWIIIAVPTPTPSVDTGGDASAVREVLAELGEYRVHGDVVIRSTMPPGETAPLADEYDFPLVYSPEFLRDRSDVADFFDPDRIVAAGPDGACRRFRELMAPVLDESGADWITTDYLSAELGKEAHNSFFATKVSFANQMRLIAERRGANPRDVMSIVTTDRRNTTSHLDPMLGPYGGKCLPKDIAALTAFAHDVGAPADLLEATRSINDHADKYENVEIQGSFPNVSTTGD